MKLKRYIFWVPGIVYRGEEYAKNKREAINQFKKRFELKNLPKDSYVLYAHDFVIV